MSDQEFSLFDQFSKLNYFVFLEKNHVAKPLLEKMYITGLKIRPPTQGGQRFWNSWNSLNCSGIFLVLEMYLKKPLFQACSGIVLEFRIFDERLLRLQHFRLPPVWISHLFLKNVKMFLKCSGIALEFCFKILLATLPYQSIGTHILLIKYCRQEESFCYKLSKMAVNCIYLVFLS